MKERFLEIAQSFFISVTLIDVAMWLLGVIFRPDQRFGYEIFLYPLLYGIIGVIPAAIMGEKKELTIWQTVIRKTVQLLLLLVLLLAYMFAGQPLNAETAVLAAAVSGSIVLIYVLVNVICWMLDLRTARSMTEDLRAYQKHRMQ